MHKRVLLVLVGILTLGYPLLVYLSQGLIDEHWVALIPLALGAMRYACEQRDPLTWTLIICSVINAVPVWVIHDDSLLKAYPSIVSIAFLILFGQSLLRPPSMVERIARSEEPDLPEYAIHYTRHVTEVWCAFFLINGSIAAYLALYSSDKIWLIYTGFISYLLIGLLFAVEWCIRKRVRARHA